MALLSDFGKYFLIGVFFWAVVDFTTAFNPNVSDWIAHMPLIWAFYLGSPLVFAYLIYVKKWSDGKLVLPLILVLFSVEILFSSNALLFTFPVMLVMIPVALGLYGFITYVPRWIVDKTFKKHLIITAIMFSVWAAVAVLSYVTRARG